MFIRKLLLAFFAMVAVGGCASVYTSIRQNDDGTYMLTHTKQGCFRTYGEVYRCTPKGQGDLDCQSIDRL